MFNIYYADCIGREGNCLYPHKADVTDAASLAQAVSRDYVCAEYKNSYRSNANFIASNCLAVEFDNRAWHGDTFSGSGPERGRPGEIPYR